MEKLVWRNWVRNWYEGLGEELGEGQVWRDWVTDWVRDWCVRTGRRDTSWDLGEPRREAQVKEHRSHHRL